MYARVYDAKTCVYASSCQSWNRKCLDICLILVPQHVFASPSSPLGHDGTGAIGHAPAMYNSTIGRNRLIPTSLRIPHGGA